MLKVRFNLRKVATIVACLIAIIFTSCGSDGDGNEMRLTVQGNGKIRIIIDGYGTASIDWGDGSTKKIYELTGNKTTCEWQYSQTSSRTIKITGKNITMLAPGSEIEVQLMNLDVSRNAALKTLVGWGDLTSLDVSKNNALTQLFVNGTQLTNLDVSKNNVLKILDVSDNQLTDLDVSELIELSLLKCKNNQLTTDALNALFETLHNNNVAHPSGFGTAKFIVIHNNPGTETCDRNIVEKKGWAFTIN